MKKLTALMLVLTMTVVMAGCGKEKKTAAPKSDAGAINVMVVEAQTQTIEDNVTYTGEIKASESTSVSAKAGGAAKVVYKDIGDYVNAGDVLLQIDDTDYRTQYNQALAAQNQTKAAYAQAEAAYNQAKASYEGALAAYNSATNGTAEQTKLQLEAALDAAKIEYNNAKLNYENQKVLYENGAVSKTVYDAAVTRFENAQLNLNTAQSNYDLTVSVILEESKTNAQSGVKAAEAGLKSAEAGMKSAQAAVNSATVAVDAAQNALNDTVVKAPISGYIAARNANKGQMVAPGVEIFSIKATATVEAQINVTEAVIPSLSIGTKAVINVKSAGMEDTEGTVTSINPVKNAQTGMYMVSIAIDNSEGLLKDGMFADITLTLKDSADALVVPSEAVLEDENGTKYVYVAKGDKAARADVEIGITTNEITEISSGLSVGDKVVVSGQDYLSEKNNLIKVVE